ncbi:O-antigen ligase family protein [Flavobacterium kingsejongi]|uniref:O-antigen ligase-related domain-containing protein n=1 Tax=Flavobacterium kingsejongi TaxID=1678728 RepID=A0A2S1LP07_9FLAO|nr:O-antigen ligase family protein [Flavobacterium kingsejongi]AWG25366.1 hypothetical protein FK004_09000 [Flavobacterium kingsejongi]
MNKIMEEGNNNKSKKALFLVLTIIFLTDDTLLFGTNKNDLFVYGKYFIYIIILLLTVLFSAKNIVSKSNFNGIITILVLILILFLSTIINNDFKTGTLVYAITFFTGIAIVQNISFPVFTKLYSKIMYFLAFFSLIVYTINLISPDLISIFPTISNYGDVEYKFVLFSNTFNGFNEFRNTGIFREPGVYVIHLIFAVFFEVFFIKSSKLNYRKLLIFVLAILTTLSTTGILLLPVILIIYFIKNSNLKNAFFIFGISMFFVFILNYFPELNDKVFSKLTQDGAEYESSLARLSSFLTPLYIIKDNMIFGSGLSNFVTYYSYYSRSIFGIEFLAESAATNTILNLTAVYGIIYGLIITILLFRASKLIEKKYYIIVFILMLLLFSSQELKFSLFFNVLLGYGLYFNKQKDFS